MTKINQNAYVNPEAKQILKNKIGYRCLDQTNSDYHNPKDIILFETNELGNTDIGETMLKFYNFKFNDALHGTDNNPEINEAMAAKLVDYLKQNVGSDFDLVWVTADKKTALENYGDEDQGNLEEWNFGADSNFMIISDLGYDGQLIAYQESKVQVLEV